MCGCLSIWHIVASRFKSTNQRKHHAHAHTKRREEIKLSESKRVCWKIKIHRNGLNTKSKRIVANIKLSQTRCAESRTSGKFGNVYNFHSKLHFWFSMYASSNNWKWASAELELHKMKCDFVCPCVIWDVYYQFNVRNMRAVNCFCILTFQLFRISRKHRRKECRRQPWWIFWVIV